MYKELKNPRSYFFPPVYLMFIRLLPRRGNISLKSALSNIPALLLTSFLPVSAYSSREQSKIGACGCFLSDSLLGARKRNLLIGRQREVWRYFPQADEEQTGTRNQWVRRN